MAADTFHEPPPDQPGRTIISMWSGPRNISTTMMRSFENRPDTAVLDEPFYGVFLARSGADHPHRHQILESYPNTFEEALAWINAQDAPITVNKHIAYHVAAHLHGAPHDPSIDDGAEDALPSWMLDWIGSHKNILLIRDPRRMVASFQNKHDDIRPIAKSTAIAEHIFAFLTERGAPCPIVDAQDILAAPGPMLRRICQVLEIPYDSAIDHSMLNWPAGRRNSDGPWAPHWYDAVEASTGFRSPAPSAPLVLPPALESATADAMPAYLRLFEKRMTV